MKDRIKQRFLSKCRVRSEKILFVILILSPLQTINAQSFKATILQQVEFEHGRTQGLHQHSVNSALLVSIVQGRFGIHRYDFAGNRFETLKVIVREPLENKYTPEPRVRFHTVKGVTYLVIRGKLFSSDGTREGTQFIRDFGIHFAGGSPGVSERSNLESMHSMENNLLFTIRDISLNRTQLWVSDGTRLGTRKLGSNFTSVGEMFNIENDTFFFGEMKNNPNSVAIWQVSENGTRLSKVLEESFNDFQAESQVVVDKNKAYFCLNNVLAIFSNKNLRSISSVRCDRNSHFEENGSGVFFNLEAEMFLFDPIRLQAISIYESEELADGRIESRCSTADSLVFTVKYFGSSSPADRLFSYSRTSGLQRKVFSPEDYIDLETCLKDSAVIMNSGYSIYAVAGNNLINIRNLVGFTRFNSHTLEADNPIVFQEKIYALSFAGSILDTPKLRVMFLEVSPAEVASIIIAPIISDLLLGDDAD